VFADGLIGLELETNRSALLPFSCSRMVASSAVLVFQPAGSGQPGPEYKKDFKMARSL
jgi:hypothetical protein